MLFNDKSCPQNIDKLKVFIPQLFHSAQSHLSPFLRAFKLVTAFGVVGYVERVIASRELLQ